MVDGNSDGAWYEPYHWGFGAGKPIAWQGWLLMTLQIAAAVFGVIHFAGNEDAQLAVLMGAIVIPMPLIMAKTRGGWRWRWGNQD